MEEIIIMPICDMCTIVVKSKIQMGCICQYPIADKFEKIVIDAFTL